MPIYEMNPSDVMGADVGSIKQPDPNMVNRVMLAFLMQLTHLVIKMRFLSCVMRSY